jgi:hypothetical protein
MIDARKRTGRRKEPGMPIEFMGEHEKLGTPEMADGNLEALKAKIRSRYGDECHETDRADR